MHSPPTSRIKSGKGFTLIEVAMASVVALIAVVGLIDAVTIGSEMLDVAHKQTVAMQIIRNEIDGIHLQDWTKVSSLPTSASVTVNNTGDGLSAGSAFATAFALTNYSSSVSDDNTALMSSARNFTCGLTVTTITGRSNFRVLTYTVTWTGGNRGKTYSRSGTTYYARRGLNVFYRR
jgi:prepilin-type N-terminal cleavage/methylation domain-containing protein